MGLILNPRWRGVVALVYGLAGVGIVVAMGFPPPSEIFVAGMLFLWLGPVLLLALSGARNGSFVSRVCGTLVLVMFVAIMARFLIPPLPDDPH